MNVANEYAQQVEQDLKELGFGPLTRLPELLKRLGISREVAYSAIRRRTLRATRLGGGRGQFVLRRGDVAVWLAQHRTA